MRLLPHEVEAIRAAVREVFGPTARIRLFGSRARDDLKGGDIDLFVEVEPGQASIANEQVRADVLSGQGGGRARSVAGAAAGRQYLFNVWDSLAHNAVARVTHETVAAFFPSDPPQFYRVPFSLSDTARVSAWLAAPGFENVAPIPVAQAGTSPSAAEAAEGLIEGNPIAAAIAERRAAAVPEVKAAVARKP